MGQFQHFRKMSWRFFGDILVGPGGSGMLYVSEGADGNVSERNKPISWPYSRELHGWKRYSTTNCEVSNVFWVESSDENAYSFFKYAQSLLHSTVMLLLRCTVLGAHTVHVVLLNVSKVY